MQPTKCFLGLKNRVMNGIISNKLCPYNYGQSCFFTLLREICQIKAP